MKEPSLFASYSYADGYMPTSGAALPGPTLSTPPPTPPPRRRPPLKRSDATWDASARAQVYGLHLNSTPMRRGPSGASADSGVVFYPQRGNEILAITVVTTETSKPSVNNYSDLGSSTIIKALPSPPVTVTLQAQESTVEEPTQRTPSIDPRPASGLDIMNIDRTSFVRLPSLESIVRVLTASEYSQETVEFPAPISDELERLVQNGIAEKKEKSEKKCNLVKRFMNFLHHFDDRMGAHFQERRDKSRLKAENSAQVKEIDRRHKEQIALHLARDEIRNQIAKRKIAEQNGEVKEKEKKKKDAAKKLRLEDKAEEKREAKAKTLVEKKYNKSLEAELKRTFGSKSKLGAFITHPLV